MIVRKIYQGYEIIFQRNHALLAGALARELKGALRPPHWTETLSAILEHDDGQTDWSDAEWITDEGHPIDFSERGFDLAQAQRVTNESSYKSTWVQLLISMHATSLCQASENQTPEMLQFVTEQKDIQRKLRKLHSLRKTEVEGYYRFLRWCDECSLILCKGAIDQNKRRPMTIGEITSRTTVQMARTSDGFLTITPWCFHNEFFTVSAELFRMKQTCFQSTEELKNHIANTRPTTKTWTFKKT